MNSLLPSVAVVAAATTAASAPSGAVLPAQKQSKLERTFAEVAVSRCRLPFDFYSVKQASPYLLYRWFISLVEKPFQVGEVNPLLLPK